MFGWGAYLVAQPPPRRGGPRLEGPPRACSVGYVIQSSTATLTVLAALGVVCGPPTAGTLAVAPMLHDVPKTGETITPTAKASLRFAASWVQETQTTDRPRTSSALQAPAACS